MFHCGILEYVSWGRSVGECVWGGSEAMLGRRVLRTAPEGAPRRHFRCTQGPSLELEATRERGLIPSSRTLYDTHAE